MRTMDAFLSRKSQLWVVYVSWLSAAVLAFADLATGMYISLVLLYLIPVFLLTWYDSESMGALLAVTISSVWFYEAFASQPTGSLVTPAFNSVVRLGGFLLIVYMIGRLREMFDCERKLARTDPLTGALNRRAFDELIYKEVERSRRHQRLFTLAYLDLNDFKSINDHFGHSTGDTVLKNTVLTTRRSLRINDTIARFGGDEFVILLPETERNAAHTVLSRVQQRLAVEMQQHGWPVTCSIGAVSYRVPPETVAQILHTADHVMYTAKQLSKNYLVVLDAEEVHAADDAPQVPVSTLPAQSQDSPSAQTT